MIKPIRIRRLKAYQMLNPLASFKSSVRVWLKQEIRNRCLHFNSILRQAKNCDPLMLSVFLDELVNDNQIFYDKEKSIFCDPLCATTKRIQKAENENKLLLRSACKTPDKIVNEILDKLPEPSPVYSQWWFTPGTFFRLKDLIFGKYGKKTDRIAFLGASTLGAVISRLSRSEVFILDADDILLQKLDCDERAVKMPYNVHQEIDLSLHQKFSMVFADPAWGRTTLRLFLIRSATLLAQDGLLLISFPHAFTRPSMQSERTYLLTLAKRLGLVLQEVIMGSTEYSVPPFEKEAYQILGINLDAPWRTGDTFVFRRTQQPLSKRGKESHVQQITWKQFVFGKFRLFLKEDSQSHIHPKPGIYPILGLDGYIHPTTSSRTKFWSEATLVSTRNHLARAVGFARVCDLLQQVPKKSSLYSTNPNFPKDVVAFVNKKCSNKPFLF